MAAALVECKSMHLHYPTLKLLILSLPFVFEDLLHAIEYPFFSFPQFSRNNEGDIHALLYY
jgi:hypothetical protein